MNKKTPSHVVVGYAPITIREIPEDEAIDRNINGWWNYEKSMIEIAEELSPQVKAEVLLHEILHACCTFGNVGLNDEEEERVVQGLTPVLLKFLCENENLIKWMQKQVEDAYP